MRRTAQYLGGILLATGATLTMAVPAQASPYGCRDIYGYGTNVILVSELRTYAWEYPYIVGGFAFRDRGIYNSYVNNDFYGRDSYNAYTAINSFNTINSNNTYNSVIDLGGLFG